MVGPPEFAGSCTVAVAPRQRSFVADPPGLPVPCELSLAVAAALSGGPPRPQQVRTGDASDSQGRNPSVAGPSPAGRRCGYAGTHGRHFASKLSGLQVVCSSGVSQRNVSESSCARCGFWGETASAPAPRARAPCSQLDGIGTEARHGDDAHRAVFTFS